MTFSVTRRDLGLGPAGGRVRPLSHVAGLTVHHTTGATLAEQGTQDRDAVFRWVRNLWSFHTDRPLPAHGRLPEVKPWKGARGWADLGYHALVHIPLRLVIQGRPINREGAHSPPVNGTHLGLAVLGSPGRLAAADVLWLADVIDQLRTAAGRPSAWSITGHRDHRATSCPGDALYAALPTLRGAPPPYHPEDEGDDVSATLDALGRIERIGSAVLLGQLADTRAATGLPTEPESDAVWLRRIAAGRATIHDAERELVARAADEAGAA